MKLVWLKKTHREKLEERTKITEKVGKGFAKLFQDTLYSVNSESTYTISLIEYPFLPSLLNKHCTKYMKNISTKEQPAWGAHTHLPCPDDNPPNVCRDRMIKMGRKWHYLCIMFHLSQLHLFIPFPVSPVIKVHRQPHWLQEEAWSVTG